MTQRATTTTTRRRRRGTRGSGGGGAAAALGLALWCCASRPHPAAAGLLRHPHGSVVHTEYLSPVVTAPAARSDHMDYAAKYPAVSREEGYEDGGEGERDLEGGVSRPGRASLASASGELSPSFYTPSSVPTAISLVLVGISPIRLPDDEERGHMETALIDVLNGALAKDGLDTVQAIPLGESILEPAAGGDGQFPELRVDMHLSARDSAPRPTVEYGTRAREVLADANRMADLTDRLRHTGDSYFAGLVGARTLPPSPVEASATTPISNPPAETALAPSSPAVDEAASGISLMQGRTADNSGAAGMTLQGGIAPELLVQGSKRPDPEMALPSRGPLDASALDEAAAGTSLVEGRSADNSGAAGLTLQGGIAPELLVEGSERPDPDMALPSRGPPDAAPLDEATGGISFVQGRSADDEAGAAGLTIQGGIAPEDLVEGSDRPGPEMVMPARVPPKAAASTSSQDRHGIPVDILPDSHSKVDYGWGGSGMDAVRTSKGVLLGPNYVESPETSNRVNAVRTSAAAVLFVLVASVAIGNAAARARKMKDRKACYGRRRTMITRAKEAYEAPWKKKTRRVRVDDRENDLRRMTSGVIR